MLLLARYARSAAISIIYKLDMPTDSWCYGNEEWPVTSILFRSF